MTLELGSIAVIVFRYGHWAQKLRIPIVRQIAWIVYWILNMGVMVAAGINIQASSKIGKGLVIHNFSGIFVWSDNIGEDCTINQGVTVGNIRGSKSLPQIGKNVYLGAGCKVLGNVRIGNDVVIGANSLVISDIPDNCTVIGVPGRIMSRDAKSEYLKFQT